MWAAPAHSSTRQFSPLVLPQDSCSPGTGLGLSPAQLVPPCQGQRFTLLWKPFGTLKVFKMRQRHHGSSHGGMGVTHGQWEQSCREWKLCSVSLACSHGPELAMETQEWGCSSAARKDKRMLMGFPRTGCMTQGLSCQHPHTAGKV